MTVAGVVFYSIVNVVVGFFIFFAAMEGSGGGKGFMVFGAVLLAVVGLGAGIGLLFFRRPWATGLGLGLMLGWALWSIVSAGFCTGLNPGFYT